MDFLNFIIGAALLTLGRKLFWLFVGCMGFVLGFYYAPQLWGIRPQWVLLILSVLTGIAGAIIAVFFQKVAIGLAGFGAGSFVAVNLVSMLGLKSGPLIWLPYIVGGILGVLLLFLMFDWALIFLSSISGAALIVQTLHLKQWVEFGLFWALVIAGVFIQTILLRQERPVHGSKSTPRK